MSCDEVYYSFVDSLPLSNDFRECSKCGKGGLFEFRKGNNEHCFFGVTMSCLDKYEGKLSVSYVYSCSHVVVNCLRSCPRLENTKFKNIK